MLYLPDPSEGLIGLPYGSYGSREVSFGFPPKLKGFTMTLVVKGTRRVTIYYSVSVFYFTVSHVNSETSGRWGSVKKVLLLVKHWEETVEFVSVFLRKLSTVHDQLSRYSGDKDRHHHYVRKEVTKELKITIFNPLRRRIRDRGTSTTSVFTERNQTLVGRVRRTSRTSQLLDEKRLLVP